MLMLVRLLACVAVVAVVVWWHHYQDNCNTVIQGQFRWCSHTLLCMCRTDSQRWGGGSAATSQCTPRNRQTNQPTLSHHNQSLGFTWHYHETLSPVSPPTSPAPRSPSWPGYQAGLLELNWVGDEGRKVPQSPHHEMRRNQQAASRLGRGRSHLSSGQGR